MQCKVEKSLFSSVGDAEQGYVGWKPRLHGERGWHRSGLVPAARNVAAASVPQLSWD